jgi:hypothetical protein
MSKIQRDMQIQEEERINEDNLTLSIEEQKRRAYAKKESLRHWEEQLELVKQERNAEKEAQQQLNKNKIIV